MPVWKVILASSIPQCLSILMHSELLSTSWKRQKILSWPRYLHQWKLSVHLLEFPIGPVVRTLRIHCRRSGFHLWSGAKFLQALSYGQKKVSICHQNRSSKWKLSSVLGEKNQFYIGGTWVCLIRSSHYFCCPELGCGCSDWKSRSQDLSIHLTNL